MGPDLSKLNFWSGANYMKRYDADNPYTDVTVGSFGNQTLTVHHGLGHIPEFDVQAELQSNGRIWTGNRPMPNYDTADAPYFDAWTSNDDLTIVLHNPVSGSKTVRIYHIIYKDYA